jgi:DNA mismatch repair protein MutL
MLKSMRYVSGGSRGLWLDGFVGIGDSARGTRSNQSFFINGRYMKSAILAQALEQGCRERVTIGHFPTCVLHLKMALELVDVNVHPNKMEVRFQSENDVFESVRDMILDVLHKDDPLENVPEMDLNPVQTPLHLHPNNIAVMSTVVSKTDYGAILPGAPSEKKAVVDNGPKFNIEAAKIEPQSSSEVPVQVPIVVPVPSREQVPVLRETHISAFMRPTISPEQAAVRYDTKPPAVVDASIPEKAEAIPALPEKELKPDLKILGVVFQTYVLIEYGDQLLLIDQHAAHERLLFDRMIKAYDQKAASQALLVPQVVTLTHRELETLQENQEALSQTGFEISSFGDHAVQIRSVPIILGQPQAKSFLLELLDELETMRGLTTLEKRRTAVLQMACKRAVKGGERLPQVEIEDLIRRATETGVTPTCPHGRPLVISITHQDLDKRFKRIQ